MAPQRPDASVSNPSLRSVFFKTSKGTSSRSPFSFRVTRACCRQSFRQTCSHSGLRNVVLLQDGRGQPPRLIVVSPVCSDEEVAGERLPGLGRRDNLDQPVGAVSFALPRVRGERNRQEHVFQQHRREHHRQDRIALVLEPLAVGDGRRQDLVDLGVRLALGPPEEPADHLDQFRDGMTLAKDDAPLGLGPIEAFLAGVQGNDDVHFAAVVQVGLAGLAPLLGNEIEHLQVADEDQLALPADGGLEPLS